MSIDPAHLSIRPEITRPRTTPSSPERQFRAALGGSAQALLDHVEAASGLSPTAAALTAAVRGTASQTSAPPLEDGLGLSGGQMMEDSTRLLLIQQQIQSENQRFSTLSNVMKARHETAKNAINNIR